MRRASARENAPEAETTPRLAIDPNRVLEVAVVAMLVLRSLVKIRARTKRVRAKAS